MNTNVALLAATVLAGLVGQSEASPVAVSGSFSGLAYNSVAPGGSFDGSAVSGIFSMQVGGSGDYNDGTTSDSLITGTSFSMTIFAGGRTVEFANPNYEYLFDTKFPGGGAESEIRVSGGDASGYHLTLDLFGDILASSSPSSVKPGAVDITHSFVKFSGAEFGANTSLSGISFGGVPGVRVLPEPSTLLLVTVALAAIVRASRRRVPV